MKRYSLWVKCLVFFLAVVTLLGVAVSGLGILAAESQCMYTHDNYEDWIHSQYQDRAHMIADQVLMDYGASLSDCPTWILEQTNYANAIQHVKNWYELSESNWRYTIQKDGKILRNTYSDSFEKDALHFAFMLDFSYPMVGISGEYTQYFHETVTDEPVPVHYQYDSGYQVDIYISRYISFDNLS